MCFVANKDVQNDFLGLSIMGFFPFRLINKFLLFKIDLNNYFSPKVAFLILFSIINKYTIKINKPKRLVKWSDLVALLQLCNREGCVRYP